MAEYIERRYLLNKVCERCYEDMPEEPCEPSECFVREIIKELLPAADVVKVCRCRDCKNGRELKHNDLFENGFVDGCIWCMKHSRISFTNDFCSYGERRDGIE